MWCHQPPRDKTFSSDACVQLGTDRSTALFSRVRPSSTGLSSLPPGSIAAAVVEHETPIAPSASSRRRFVCSGVWCHQPPRDKTFSSDACVQLGTDRSTALFSRVRPSSPSPARETTTGLSSLPPGSIAAAVVEHETPIAPSASSRRRFVCSGVWCHQPPRDKTFSSDACVQLGTDRSTALFSRVRPLCARTRTDRSTASPPDSDSATPCPYFLSWGDQPEV